MSVLVGRGLSENTVRLGSVPEQHLRFVGETIARHAQPALLRALHVGNFVGVSLAALSDIVARHSPESVVVSIDPNLDHLGVHDPQRHTLALLDHFGLRRHNILICAYSLQREANRTHAGIFAEQPAGENALTGLELLGNRFEVAMIDGNHDGGYVRREVEVVVRLLSDGALLILDDVSPAHPHLRELFDELAQDSAWPFEKIDQDSRIGILRRTPGVL